MTIDTWLGLFGLLSGLVGSFLAYFFYKKSIRTKVLAISYTDPIPLMINMGDIEVVYEGKALSALSRVYVLFWNRGTAPIEASDFLSTIAITTSEPILNLQIHDKDAAVAAVLDEKTSSISIELLRPGEAITLVAEVTSEAYRPNLRVQMKSADMSTSIRGNRTLYPSIAGFVTAMVFLLMEIAIIYAWRDIIPSPSAGHEPLPGFFIFMIMAFLAIAGGVIVVGVIPFSFGFVAQKLTRKFLARTTTPVAWNFFELKMSAWTIRIRLKDFRKFMDAEYKKIAPS
jgi:hypothetical protein